MSDLEALCHALEDVVRALPTLAHILQQRAARLRLLAAEVQRAASRAEDGPDCSRVIHGLHEAARALEASATALAAAAQQSRAFVERTVGGPSSHLGPGFGPASGLDGAFGSPPSAASGGSSEAVGRSEASPLAIFWESHDGEYLPPTDEDWSPVPTTLSPHSDPRLFTRWVNDGGAEQPGRGDNCADCARAFESSWRGQPQVSAARADGQGGEDFRRIEEWLGVPLERSSFARIGSELADSGHGASAYVVVIWRGGGGHAFNAVNYQETVLFVDSQPTGGAVDTWPPTRSSPGYGFDESDVSMVFVSHRQPRLDTQPAGGTLS